MLEIIQKKVVYNWSMNKTATVKIKKLDLTGAGITDKTINGKPIYVWGALPDEEVVCRIVKSKKNRYEAVAEKILTVSTKRQNPKEDHYLACSVFQILNYTDQIKLKKSLAESELKRQLGWQNSVDLLTADNIYYYRNKVEYSFTTLDNSLSFAYHNRGQKEKLPVANCILLDQSLQKKLNNLLEFLNQLNLPKNIYKTVLARCDQSNNVIAGLFLYHSNDEIKKSFEQINLAKLGLKGFGVYLSPAKSPASVVEKTIFESGSLELENRLENKQFRFNLFSFFQNNILAFTRVLKDIKKFVSKGQVVLDFYSGVGTIGLSIADKAEKVVLVESNESAYKFSQVNIKLNKLKNIKSVLSTDRKARFLIKPEHTLIVDPARSGLNPKVAKHIAESKPKKIIYLSCNLKTQISDIKQFICHYNIGFIRLYDLFPNTPHLESLIVLKRKS